jgi:hypothetical protein
MSGSTENRASEASARSTHDRVLTWSAANRMLPLVRQIVADLLECQVRLAKKHPEKDHLDRQRRSLSWPERSRRYQLHEEVASDERDLRERLVELESLGVTLLDPDRGEVGFPTMVNSRKAYFSWLPGEETLAYWHYPEDSERRPIPASWTKVESSGRKARN